MLVAAEGTKLTTEELLKIIPAYNDFAVVFTDFLKMEPMASGGITETVFVNHFTKMLAHFRQFLGKKVAITDDERKNLSVVLEINKLCSTTKGVSASPDLFVASKVYFALYIVIIFTIIIFMNVFLTTDRTYL